mmetsp:Transcript_48519/g.154966  ORF Transcript_48519/g.154966 Transcript_48519/m.154966 type:complete len:222 (+) Transcript_48519:894-1559(+)
MDVHDFGAQEVDGAKQLVATGCLWADPANLPPARAHLHPQPRFLALLALVEAQLQGEHLLAGLQLADPLAREALGLAERGRALDGVARLHLPRALEASADERSLARPGLAHWVLECNPPRGLARDLRNDEAHARSGPLVLALFGDADEQHLLRHRQHPHLHGISLWRAPHGDPTTADLVPTADLPVLGLLRLWSHEAEPPQGGRAATSHGRNPVFRDVLRK